MAEGAPLHRLIVTAVAGQPGVFDACLEGEGVVLVRSRQPVVAAARRLLELGFSPDELLTMRHEGKDFDSFEPLPIRQWVRVPGDGKIAPAGRGGGPAGLLEAADD